MAKVQSMDQTSLEQVSKEKLIDLILAQQATVETLEARIVAQQATIETLEAQIVALEAKLSKPKKTSKNSSIPASKEYKSNQKKSSKKRGPKKGHVGKSRKRIVADVTVDMLLETCQSCGADLSEIEQYEVGRSQVVEIPPIEPVVIEAIAYGGECPCCGEVQRAVYPEGLEAQRVFGPNLEGLVVYLRQVHHLSFARLESVLEAVFGLAISQGALNNILKRSAQHLKPAAERIKQMVRGSPVVGSDETSARVEGRNWWEWVFQTPLASYHHLGPSRSSAEIESVIGDSRVEVWVSDLFSAQLKGARTHADAFAMCGAHQLRDLQFAIDCGDELFAPAFQLLLLEAKALSEQRDTFPPDVYQELATCVQTTCDFLLALDVDFEVSQNLQRRYTDHRDSIFLFLDRPDVPFDNNASERALRNSVIHRKVTGGFRSDHGPQSFAITTTIVQTARKNNLPILDTLRSLLPPSPLLLVGQGE